MTTLVCNKRGDQRFWDEVATVQVNGVTDTIANHFREATKTNELVIDGFSYEKKYSRVFYNMMWVRYLNANPLLVQEASKYRDYKGNSADVIRTYIKESCKDVLNDPELVELAQLMKANKTKPKTNSLVEIVEGDLLTSDCFYIAHCANCQSTMGAGIAKDIKAMYPEAYQVDCDDKRTPNEKLGNFTAARSNGKVIVNLYGQLNYGKGLQLNYQALYKALYSFLSKAPADKKIGIPFNIGCGKAGGDWNKVYSYIQHAAAQTNKKVYIYKKQ